MPISAAAELFRRLDRELWLVTAQTDRARGGLIATFVNQASLVAELPRVVVGLARHHHTWALVEESGALGLHLLAERHLEWVWRFGLQSGRSVDKFAGLELANGQSAAPRLAGTPGWLDCRVEARLDTGDRTLYLAEVVAAEFASATVPLTVSRMLELTPVEKRKQLQEQVAHDSAIDASAIEAWRRMRPER